MYVPSPAAVRSTGSGLEHGAQPLIWVAPRSTRQSKVAPASPEKPHATVGSLPGDCGELVIVAAAGADWSRT